MYVVWSPVGFLNFILPLLDVTHRESHLLNASFSTWHQISAGWRKTYHLKSLLLLFFNFRSFSFYAQISYSSFFFPWKNNFTLLISLVECKKITFITQKSCCKKFGVSQFSEFSFFTSRFRFCKDRVAGWGVFKFFEFLSKTEICDPEVAPCTTSSKETSKAWRPASNEASAAASVFSFRVPQRIVGSRQSKSPTKGRTK